MPLYYFFVLLASKERYVPPSQRLKAAAQGIQLDTTKRFLSQTDDPSKPQGKLNKGCKARVTSTSRERLV